MPSLVDIAPPELTAEEVEIRGTKLKVQGISGEGWMTLYARHPVMRALVARGRDIRLAGGTDRCRARPARRREHRAPGHGPPDDGRAAPGRRDDRAAQHAGAPFRPFAQRGRGGRSRRPLYRGAGYEILAAAEALAHEGHGTIREVLKAYTPKQMHVLLFIVGKRRAHEDRRMLALNAMAARGDQKDLRKAMKDPDE
jgi:hypothetical protein